MVCKKTGRKKKRNKLSITAEEIRTAFNREMSTADIYFPIRSGSEKLDVEDFLLWYLSESHASGRTPAFEQMLEFFEKNPFSWLKPQNYPPQWAEMIDAHPFGLAVRGPFPAIEEETKTASIVGSRNADDEACRLAFEAARSLAENSVLIVSGGALGIDSSAHRGALAAGGSTIAVSAASIPALLEGDNAELFREIIAAGGCVATTAAPMAGLDMTSDELAAALKARNKWVALLGDFTVAAAARKGSSTMIEVEYALAAKRRVFAASSIPAAEFREWIAEIPVDADGESLVQEFSDVEDLKAKTNGWRSIWWL